jgi:broad specificity phosphatase PhoE
MNLLLIRHAQSVGNSEGRLQGQADYPLCDEGRDQARALTRRLQREAWPIAAAYTSDLSRAMETAQIVAEAFGLSVIPDRRLREYDFGELNGIVWRDVEQRYPEVWRLYHQEHRWGGMPGEEGRPAFCDRLAAAMADIAARHQTDGAVAVVSHAGSLGVILAQLLHTAALHPNPFRFDNTSLSVVKFSRHGPVLTLHNSTYHLHAF